LYLYLERKDVLEKSQPDDDTFDVAVEDAISDHPSKRVKQSDSKFTRRARDQKYGFGGARRRSKQNTKESTDDFDFGSTKRGKAGGAKGDGRFGRGRHGSSLTDKGGKSGSRAVSGSGKKRLGKARRMNARSTRIP
jgi:rRNA-processing protein EBP2